METYDTLSAAVNDLAKRGYTSDFKFCKDAIECSVLELKLYPENFSIVEVHHFDGMTDPADESIVYAIESMDGKIKGVLVNGYGIYTDELSDTMLKKLKEHH